ncbi:MAG: SRPBCC family protein [Bacteroidia bacterium]
MIVIYIIAGLIAAVLIIAALMPSSYSIEKIITINASPEKVYGKISDLNQYRDWNPWQKMEPESKSTITGTPATPGHKFAWEGKKIGMGSLTIKEVKPFSEVHITLEFLKPWKALASDDWKFEKAGDRQVKVTWSNSGPLAYPMARLMSPLINKNLNQQFEQGLNNLKEVCEK